MDKQTDRWVESCLSVSLKGGEGLLTEEMSPRPAGGSRGCRGAAGKWLTDPLSCPLLLCRCLTPDPGGVLEPHRLHCAPLR